MSSEARVAHDSTAQGAHAAHAWSVRRAEEEDVPAVAAAVAQLLRELGGAPPSDAALQTATQSLIDDKRAGAVVVADTGPANAAARVAGSGQGLIGVLAASWQLAIHIPGRYGLIQDLWVAPQARSQSVGAALVAALCELARDRGIGRLEVGLPRESFAALEATRAFYEREGFSLLGPRLRRILS